MLFRETLQTQKTHALKAKRGIENRLEQNTAPRYGGLFEKQRQKAEGADDFGEEGQEGEKGEGYGISRCLRRVEQTAGPAR